MRRLSIFRSLARGRTSTFGSLARGRAATFFATACLVLLSAPSLRADKPKPKQPSPDRGAPQPQNANECAKAEASARYVGYGYTHVVTLKNGCERAVTCELWTNVDETPHATVQVAPGQSAEVVTRRGSPSRDVVASKTCSFR